MSLAFGHFTMHALIAFKALRLQTFNASGNLMLCIKTSEV